MIQPETYKRLREPTRNIYTDVHERLERAIKHVSSTFTKLSRKTVKNGLHTVKLGFEDQHSFFLNLVNILINSSY